MGEQRETSMAPKYHPEEVEKGRYQFWMEGKFFEAEENDQKEPYTIVIPPPNVTGRLHLGHAWDTTLQDILTRYKRMQGYDVLWLPGMDHAGIATQAKVERSSKKKAKADMTLDEKNFLSKPGIGKKEYASFIRSQWEKLGLGLDYSKERFTLDEGLSNAVKEVFVSFMNKD